MTTYTDPTTVNVAHKKRVSVEFGLAALNNPTAIAEGNTNAPVVRGGWIPYDMAAYGDGADGVIYDFSTDGAVAIIESPSFVAGWEYMLVLNALQSSSGYTDLRIQGYRVNDSTWVTLHSLVTADWNPAITTDAQTAIDGTITLPMPMTNIKRVQRHDGAVYLSSSGVDAGAFVWDEVTAPVTGGVTYSKLRLSLVSSGSTAGGTVYLYRRGFGEL